MIHRVKEDEIKHLRELIKLAEENDLVVVERGENDPSIVVAIDEKYLQTLSCISFLTDQGFIVRPTFMERIVKGS